VHQVGFITRILVYRDARSTNQKIPENVVEQCGKTPLIGINLDGEPSGQAENPHNTIFISK
jgi:hypothetical protein